ncbi:uncharacterized protein TNCT_499061 [Trichonephila clavata]|uniref:Uncharacterized protein n=1 Tax=Trichonephila clavata TaxID=2740835 RepID=A0A8X6FRM4_TRICU|nr:uncharacterized protein TNCT_499061 [Trichonephila clavata]
MSAPPGDFSYFNNRIFPVAIGFTARDSNMKIFFLTVSDEQDLLTSVSAISIKRNFCVVKVEVILNLNTPLERLALIRVAISIYNASAFSEFRDTLIEVTSLIQILPIKRLFRDRISNSVVPFLLREKLLDMFEPLSREIDSWKKDMSDFGIHKQLHICLTSSGAIDRVETAKKFVRSDDPNLLQRFTLACLFWMTEDVLNMWNKASVYERIHIEMTLLSEKSQKDERYQVSKVVTDCLKKWFDWLHAGGNPSALHSFVSESLFQYCHVPPKTNLLRALPPEKLRELIKCKYNTPYYRAYFSCLDFNQKMSFLQHEPFIVLDDHLKWPLQINFLEVASQAWEYLSGVEFLRLLRNISEQNTLPFRHIECESDFDYEGLLFEFWKQSPHYLKMLAKESNDWPCIMLNYHNLMMGWNQNDLKKSPVRRLLDSYSGPADQQTKKRRAIDM